MASSFSKRVEIYAGHRIKFPVVLWRELTNEFNPLVVIKEQGFEFCRVPFPESSLAAWMFRSVEEAQRFLVKEKEWME